MIYLAIKVYLILIYRNTAHLVDMSCVHKHQQQRYNNGKTKICMLIHYMSGVFSDEMRGRWQYGCPTRFGGEKKNSQCFFLKHDLYLKVYFWSIYLG